MKKSLLFAAAAVVFLAGVSFASGAENGEFTISDVRVKVRGEVPVDEQHVLSLVSVRSGQKTRSEIVSADIRNIIASERYSYVGVNIGHEPDGSVLTFLVEGRPILSEDPSCDGVKHFRNKTALEKLGLKAGDYVGDDIVSAAAERLRKAYLEDRYYNVKISGKIVLEPEMPQFAKVVFSVDEGVKQKVGLIKFEGNEVISDSDLRRVSGQRPWWDPVGWFSQKRVGEFELEILRADARRQYLDAGYLDAEVSEPLISVSGNKRHISFDVTEGRLYKVGGITIEGVTLFSVDSLLRGLPLRSGENAGLARLDSAREWLRSYFTSRGYIDTSVTSTYIPSEQYEGVVNVLFTVQESDIVRVRDIVIRGNTSTKDKVIRREITLNPGDIYDEVSASRSERRLNNLGFFSEVRHFSRQVGNPAERDLVYELKEQETGSLMVGIGFSSVDHLIGFFEISQSNFDIMNFKNFRGAGQKARLSFQVSSDSTDLEASFAEPWFLDRRLSLSVDAYIRNREFNEYDERKGGLEVGVSKHVPWVGRVGLSYNIEHVSIDDVIGGEFYVWDDPDKIYRYTDEDDGYLLGSMKLSWTYDTRDNPVVPTSGARAVGSAKIYNAIFGSDYDMYELDLRWRKYIGVFDKHVLAFYARGSVIDTFDDDEVPIANRYFLGGGRYVRGFKYRDIGPKVVPVGEDPGHRNHRPYGGQTMFQASVEYTIPLGRFVRIAAFYDIGNVWEDPYDFDFGEFASSIGAGIRLDFAGFPIRLDYAHALDKDDDLTRKDAFVFWMGFDN